MPAPDEDIDAAICQIADALVDSRDEGTSLIAETNADRWKLGDAGAPVRMVDNDAECTFQVAITLSGEQIEDRPFNGTEITADVTATLTNVEDDWPLSKDFEINEIKLIND